MVKKKAKAASKQKPAVKTVKTLAASEATKQRNRRNK